jgi:murein DD-endopeptidase MepM/ murein hydrolase activator NlpD
MERKGILLLFIFFSAPFLSYDQKNEMNSDSEEHIYQLPFEKGKTVLLMQGYNGKFSHKNKYALDFRLRKGRKIYAARGGKVIKVVQYHDEGGANKKYLNKGNHVIINHGDGTYAAYWHLMLNGSLVKRGDVVKTGEAIARAGSTGYSSMSHLHFMVYRYDKKGYRKTFPTKFYTSKGEIQLKSYRRYKHP